MYFSAGTRVSLRRIGADQSQRQWFVAGFYETLRISKKIGVGRVGGLVVEFFLSERFHLQCNTPYELLAFTIPTVLFFMT